MHRKKNRDNGKKNRSCLKGLILPAMWDDSGNIIGISLSTFNEEIYIIDNDEKGKELIGYMGREVELEGIFYTDGRSKKIQVNDFRTFDSD